MTKRLLLVALLFLATSQAGVISLATYPCRHPKKTARVILFPIAHPMRFIR